MKVQLRCRHCDWESEPVDGRRRQVPRGGLVFELVGTPIQEAIGAHVVEAHWPVQHAWIEGRDYEVVEAEA